MTTGMSAGRGVVLQAPAGLVAVEHRHHDVQQDEVGLLGLGDLDRREPVARLDHLEAAGLQRERHELEDVRLVVDGEDALHVATS